MASQPVAQHDGVQPQPRGRRLQPRRADHASGGEVGEPRTADETGRLLYVSDRPLQFELIPQVCLIDDICHHLRISDTQFYRLMQRGDLALVELEPMDSTRRFTGESLAFEIKRRSRRRLQ